MVHDCKMPYIIWTYSDIGLYSGQTSYLNMKVLLKRMCILTTANQIYDKC